MINGKRIAVIGIILLGVGVIGTVLTFNSNGKQEIVKETKTIEAENIKDIKIDTDNAKVEIVSTDESKITLEQSGIKKNMDKGNLKVDIAGEKLVIQLKDKQFKFFSFNFFDKLSIIKVYVPKRVYQSLEIMSNNGRIEVADINAKKVKLDTDNGRIDLDNIKGSLLTVKSDNGRIEANKIDVTVFKGYTSNGRIDLKQVQASETNLETDNGKILLNDVTGAIIAKTDNGAISLLSDDLNSPIELESDNGSITIETKNKPKNALFDAKTDNGRIDILGGDGRNTTFGNGDNLIKLTTDNGRITVTQTQ